LTANHHFAVNLNFYSPLQERDKHDTRTKQRTARSPLHERNRAVRACVWSDALEVTVTVSSEVETWPARTTNYDVHHDHRKIWLSLLTKAKKSDIWEN
jgi:hypothetical protein